MNTTTALALIYFVPLILGGIIMKYILAQIRQKYVVDKIPLTTYKVALTLLIPIYNWRTLFLLHSNKYHIIAQLTMILFKLGYLSERRETS